MVRYNQRGVLHKALLLELTSRRKAQEVTTRCFAPLPIPARCWTSFIGRAMFTIREVHGHSFCPVFRGFGVLFPMLRSKFGWILRSSVMRSLVR